MEIANFDDLLQAARLQKEPQRLLFVFTRAGLPDDASPAQRAEFAAGRGGALLPLMVTNKTPDEIASFAALVAESR
ncbi:MAG: ribonucleotide reductase subunit alpha, partial [Alphaproteobacteria bacterium]|nr:ribonucleotide reductase subunit alpha [Alphaproteobacteria bacterium]